MNEWCAHVNIFIYIDRYRESVYVYHPTIRDIIPNSYLKMINNSKTDIYQLLETKLSDMLMATDKAWWNGNIGEMDEENVSQTSKLL